MDEQYSYLIKKIFNVIADRKRDIDEVACDVKCLKKTLTSIIDGKVADNKDDVM